MNSQHTLAEIGIPAVELTWPDKNDKQTPIVSSESCYSPNSEARLIDGESATTLVLPSFVPTERFFQDSSTGISVSVITREDNDMGERIRAALKRRISETSTEKDGEELRHQLQQQQQQLLPGANNNNHNNGNKRQRLDNTPELRLLGRPEDATVLNDLHVFVREQIEVFTATPNDMVQPAPGRKNPIRLHQVGLRCIHCKNLPSRERVKRAVCFPRSVGRVYHSVSDMKFDHLPNCRGLPPKFRDRLNELKIRCTRRRSDKTPQRTASSSSSSTAQYYHDSALKMGMEDRGNGIFMNGVGIDNNVGSNTRNSCLPLLPCHHWKTPVHQQIEIPTAPPHPTKTTAAQQHSSSPAIVPLSPGALVTDSFTNVDSALSSGLTEDDTGIRLGKHDAISVLMIAAASLVSQEHATRNTC